MSIFTRNPSAEDLRAELVTAHAAQRLERDEADRAMRNRIERLLDRESELLIENRRLRTALDSMAWPA